MTAGLGSAQQASTDVQVPRLDLVGASWCLSFATRTLGLAHWQLVALAFAGDFFLPLGASVFAGTLLPAGFMQAQLTPFGIDVPGDWLAHAAGIAQPFGTDLVFLSMALVSTVAGGWVTLRALAQFESVFAGLLGSGQLRAPDPVLHTEVQRANRLLRGRLVRVFLMIMASILAGFMLARVKDPAYAGWWGHEAHGPAGLFFVVFTWLRVFFGGLFVYFLAIGLNTTSRLFRHPVTLRPFHPDECNGFGQFGNYLVWMMVLALLIAAALWITFWNGYLGVEQLALTWLGGLLGIAFIPILLIQPLARLTRQIGASRDRQLHRFEATLQKRLSGMEALFGSATNDATLAGDMERLVSMRRAMREIYPAYPFPFKPRIAGTLGAGYAVQLVLFVNRALTTFEWL